MKAKEQQTSGELTRGKPGLRSRINQLYEMAKICTAFETVPSLLRNEIYFLLEEIGGK